MKKLVLLFFLFVVVNQTKSQTAPYSIDFETGTTGWTFNGNQWKHGDTNTLNTTNLKYGNNSTKFIGLNAEIIGGVSADDVQSPVITTNNQPNMEVSFDYYNGADLLSWGGSTYFIIKYDSTPGLPFSYNHILDTVKVTGNTWKTYKKIIPNSSNFSKLVVSIDYPNGPSNVGIDNFRLGKPISFKTKTTVTSNEKCFKSKDGKAKVTASGGSTPYSYAWSNGATTSSVNGLTKGKYYVTVTDNTGATVKDSALIGNDDKTAPVIKCPKDLTIKEGKLNYPDPVITDNCSYWWKQTSSGPKKGDHVTQSGSPYTVTLTATDSIQSKSCSFKVTVKKAVSINDLTLTNSNFSVYPNPATEKLTIDLTQQEETIRAIQLVSLTGNTVFEKETATPGLHTLDVSSLAKGIYFIKVYKGNTLMTQKVFIQ